MIYPDDQQLMQRERGMPGLPVLLDDCAMQALLCEALHDPVDALKSTYLRYKPAANCLVCYEAQIGDKKELLYAIAYDQSVAADKLASAARFLEKSDSRGCVDESLLLTVFVFPADQRLSQLPMVHTSARLDALAGVNDTSHHVLNYKPFRRCVTRVDVQGTPHAVLRVMQPDEYAQAKRTAKCLPRLDFVRQPHLLNHSDRHSALLLPWLSGPSLASFDAEEFHRHLHTLGTVAAELHQHSESKLAYQTSAMLLEQLRAAVSMAASLLPSAEEFLASIERELADQLSRQVRRCAMLHGDLHAEQVIVNEPFALLDWDRAINGDPEYDLASFLAHEYVSIRQFDEADWQATRESLLAGYLEAGQINESRLNAHLALALLKSSVLPFRRRMGDWSQRMQAAIEFASQFVAANRNALSVESTEVAYQPRTAVAFNAAEERWLTPALDPERAIPLLAENFPSLRNPVLELARVIYHKPARRALVYYRMRSSETAADVAALAKVRAKGVGWRSADLQARIHDRIGAADLQRLEVAGPLGVIPELNLWLQQPLAGRSATKCLSPESDSELCSRIGEALAELHTLDVDSIVTHTHDDELAILRKQLTRVANKRTLLGEDILLVLQRAEQLLAQFPTYEPTGIHRDFYPAQVIFRPSGKVAFVDLDLFSRGDPLIDVGNFLAHLRERAIREFGNAEALRATNRLSSTLICDCAPPPILRQLKPT